MPLSGKAALAAIRQASTSARSPGEPPRRRPAADRRGGGSVRKHRAPA
jgi:hypothetical protein